MHGPMNVKFERK